MASNHAYLQLLENFLVNLLTQKSSQINTKVLLLSSDTAMRLPLLARLARSLAGLRAGH
jgi:hypothetical protein